MTPPKYVYPDRLSPGHRYMGPADACGVCTGFGWITLENTEHYCACHCGELLAWLDGGQDFKSWLDDQRRSGVNVEVVGRYHGV